MPVKVDADADAVGAAGLPVTIVARIVDACLAMHTRVVSSDRYCLCCLLAAQTIKPERPHTDAEGTVSILEGSSETLTQ